MIIFIGADHRGFNLKEKLKQFISNRGYTVDDKGNDHYDEVDDYPDFVAAVAQEVAQDPDNRRGILICGSGVGIDVTANKFSRIRSALANNPDQAFSSRNDVDANVLCLAADFLDEEQAKKILSVWLQTPFSKEERHKRRLKKIAEIEASN
ncbi:MAG: RpiB/LacA/LacB family sugar-phosphate isomerase [bacterium]|nr:RpiB/LacA/LacB family sugar-phosphate isomerase [bacterium]